jgi:hypothetical protein
MKDLKKKIIELEWRIRKLEEANRVIQATKSPDILFDEGILLIKNGNSKSNNSCL